MFLFVFLCLSISAINTENVTDINSTVSPVEVTEYYSRNSQETKYPTSTNLVVLTDVAISDDDNTTTPNSTVFSTSIPPETTTVTTSTTQTTQTPSTSTITTETTQTTLAPVTSTVTTSETPATATTISTKTPEFTSTVTSTPLPITTEHVPQVCHGFDGWSFFGGIILGLALCLIVFLMVRFFMAKKNRDTPYRPF